MAHRLEGAFSVECLGLRAGLMREGHLPPSHLWQTARPPLSRNNCLIVEAGPGGPGGAQPAVREAEREGGRGRDGGREGGREGEREGEDGAWRTAWGI